MKLARFWNKAEKAYCCYVFDEKNGINKDIEFSSPHSSFIFLKYFSIVSRFPSTPRSRTSRFRYVCVICKIRAHWKLSGRHRL